jgi:hypothetical protein
MQGHQFFALVLSVAVVAGCRTERPRETPVPLPIADNTVDGTVVGDDRTAMEAAIDAGPSSGPMPGSSADTARGTGPVLAPGAPDSYVVKRGDTLWGISKVFLRDPWYWPEIWQVNPQVQNPHLIYPGDTLRLVYIDGRPRVTVSRGMAERGDSARVEPRVRSQPLEAAITTIPYETVAAFMSKPSVLTDDQIAGAPYVLASRDLHVVISNGDTVYARGFVGAAPLGTHYNIVRVGEALRDPDDNRIVGYDGIFTASGHITRDGDPTTLVLTESARETVPGDKLFPGSADLALDFVPSQPRIKVNGRIISVSDGVTMIGQYQVVVINRGARDGLIPGNVLAVFDVGPTVPDNVSKGWYGTSHLMAKKVKLPNERSGTFMVFKTFDRISYGLIMEAKDIIRVADQVQNP